MSGPQFGWSQCSTELAAELSIRKTLAPEATVQNADVQSDQDMPQCYSAIVNNRATAGAKKPFQLSFPAINSETSKSACETGKAALALLPRSGPMMIALAIFAIVGIAWSAMNPRQRKWAAAGTGTFLTLFFIFGAPYIKFPTRKTQETKKHEQSLPYRNTAKKDNRYNDKNSTLSLETFPAFSQQNAMFMTEQKMPVQNTIAAEQKDRLEKQQNPWERDSLSRHNVVTEPIIAQSSNLKSGYNSRENRIVAPDTAQNDWNTSKVVWQNDSDSTATVVRNTVVPNYVQPSNPMFIESTDSFRGTKQTNEIQPAFDSSPVQRKNTYDDIPMYRDLILQRTTLQAQPVIYGFERPR